MSRFSLSCIIVLLIGITLSLGEEQKTQNDNGFGYELIQFKLECLETRFSEQFEQLKKQVKQVEVAQQKFGDNVDRKITQLEKGIETSLGSKLSPITDEILKLQKISSQYDPLKNRLFNLVDCSKLENSSGLCLMDIGGNWTMVYQVHRFDADWLTVLQRSDGSVNFDRNWTDYRDGFGTAGQEFWLGLEKLHVLTKNDSYELLVELEDFSGKYDYVRYDKFSIGPEQDLYRLNVLGAYSGTEKDSLKYHEESQFSALDKGPQQSCAQSYTGGWWYDSCYHCHPTGKWQYTDKPTSITWTVIKSGKVVSLKFARMLIRKI